MRFQRIARGCLVLLLASGTVPAQRLSTKITNADVIEMVGMGLSDDVVIDKIRAADATEFDTSMEGLKSLKSKTVSDAVIRAMINPHPAPPDTNPAGVSVPKGDPNDPNGSHDPGIYMHAKGKNGLQLVMLEPTVYSKGKSGGVFKSAMTYGIANVKWKAVVRGAHANVRSGDSGMAFYFYFEEANAGLSHFGGTTTPNEFTLLKFETKKDTRETTVMKGNVFGASSGTDDKANVPFTFTKLRAGVYKVVPSASLQPGEYCFLSSAGVGTFRAGAAGATRVFDFGVISPE